MQHNTRNPIPRAALILLLAPLALAGCGGGGGGGGGSALNNEGTPPPMSGDGTPPESPSGVDDRAFDVTKIQAAARNAPKEGSVTQSNMGSGTGEDRISTTSIELDATYVTQTSPPTGTLDITRDGGDTVPIPLGNALNVLPLEDLEPTVPDDPNDPSDDFQALPSGYDFDHPDDDHHYDLVTLEADGSTAYAIIATDYLSQQGGDNYLAFGFWAYNPARHNADAEVGTFADGVEFVDGSRTLPASGTASYGGKTIGSYIDSDGQTGAVLGDVELTATFGTGDTGTINGEVSNIHIAADFDLADAELQTGDSVNLDSASIDSTGFFTGDSEYCTTAAACDGTADGKWGGQFFGVDAVDTDKPPRVGGTWGVATDGFSAIGAYGASHCSTTTSCPSE